MREWLATFKTYLKHHFVKDVLTLQAGTIIGTALSFLASLVMARVFKPELYGQYVLVFALVGLFGLLMNFGEETAATSLLAEAYNRRDRQKILEVVAYYFKVPLLVFLTVGLVSIILAPWFADLLYHQPLLGQWSRVVLLTNICLLGSSFLLFIFRVIRQIAKYTILEN